jgi:glycosyltransferase involved in cell wall biosynthesis
MSRNHKQSLASKSVAIVQDRIPDYRIPFFERLNQLGLQDGICYTIFTSSKDNEPSQWAFNRESIPAMRLKFRRNYYIHYDLKKLKDYRAIVLEMALHNPILTIFAMKNQKRSEKVLVFWGHVGYWTRKVPRFQKKVLGVLTKRADHLMIYTSEGAIRAIESGIILENITILRNSVDTQAIREIKDDISPAELQVWLKMQGLNTFNFGCAIGNFVEEKNLKFLFNALIEIKSQVESFEFIFFGEGDGLKQILKKCDEYAWIKFAGVADAQTKAYLALTTGVLLNPGRIGLIAVDSIAMGMPIVSRALDFVHAPELGYLEHPQSVILSDESLTEFVACAVNLITNKEARNRISKSLVALQPHYSVEIMANNFHNGMLGLL